ncbi:BsuPI-related putative proteinase inhibitor [Neobacillus bataviensis]|uniref:BsuPI-related putative proteinase inhibitor n=1 Tax=Neobacillus bataviensis TaxID=220685 RepID=UPI001CBFF94D|nr:BsuPI-related putative proteinase inhibitor [Neobacillus bataviensis]
MRILLCVILLFFSIAMNTNANGVNDFNYSFYLIPVADPEKVIFEIVIKNEGDLPLHFEFPTSQMIEITITDQAGAEVYVYSKGRYFLQAFQTIVVEPHQSVKRYEKWNYQFKGKRVPSGVYTVNATLKPISLNDEPIKNRAKLYHSQKLKVPEENPAFRFVKVSGTKGDYVVTGEVRPANRRLFYSVEDGHQEYIKEKEVVFDGKEEWEKFKLSIQLSIDKLPDNGSLMLNLYERDKNGNIISLYPIVLEIIH